MNRPINEIKIAKKNIVPNINISPLGNIFINDLINEFKLLRFR